MPGLREIFAITRRLSAVQRYSQSRLIVPESVLEHTGFVVLITYIIATKLNEHGANFDIGVILSKAAVHDIDEIGTGDIPRPTKYASDEMYTALSNLAKETTYKIACDLDCPQLEIDWITSKTDREGLLVSLCDNLAVLFKLWQEAVIYGNRSIIDHVDGVQLTLIGRQTEIGKLIPNLSTSVLDHIMEDVEGLISEIEALKYEGVN